MSDLFVSFTRRSHTVLECCGTGKNEPYLGKLSPIEIPAVLDPLILICLTTAQLSFALHLTDSPCLQFAC